MKTNLDFAIENAERKLPESGQPEMLCDSLKETIEALKIIRDELADIRSGIVNRKYETEKRSS